MGQGAKAPHVSQNVEISGCVLKAICKKMPTLSRQQTQIVIILIFCSLIILSCSRFLWMTWTVGQVALIMLTRVLPQDEFSPPSLNCISDLCSVSIQLTRNMRDTRTLIINLKQSMPRPNFRCLSIQHDATGCYNSAVVPGTTQMNFRH